VVLLKKDCNEPLTWTSRGVKYATPTDTSPDPDNRIQMHFGFHITPVVEIREDSRPHKRARTDASVIHGKKIMIDITMQKLDIKGGIVLMM
jgi:hypothetical protein